MKENKTVLIQIEFGDKLIYQGENDKHPNNYSSELDAIKHLKDLLKKRLDFIDISITNFKINNGIRIYFNYSNHSTIRIFSNELEAIEYLKSLYIERLKIDNGII